MMKVSPRILLDRRNSRRSDLCLRRVRLMFLRYYRHDSNLLAGSERLCYALGTSIVCLPHNKGDWVHLVLLSLNSTTM